MSDTRERILEVASELFIEQGYEATSLREISERLGFTKAALYYHFQSKDQILLALLLPGDELIHELLDRLEQADGVAGWYDALEWVVGVMAEHIDFFKLLERNRPAIEAVEGFANHGDHRLMHERVEGAVRNMGVDLATQVRMIAAIGAVTGFDDWGPTLLFEIPPEQLQPLLLGAVRDLLDLPTPKASRSRAAAAT